MRKLRVRANQYTRAECHNSQVIRAPETGNYPYIITIKHRQGIYIYSTVKDKEEMIARISKHVIPSKTQELGYTSSRIIWNYSTFV
jgi:hypothetical protein